MIIKVVELVKVDGFTQYDDVGGKIVQPKKYTLCESFLNTEHIVTFREVDPSFYDGELPEGLVEGQVFTYVNLSEMRKGMTIVEDPPCFQKKINETQNPELLKG